jgi:ubiquinone/menaquinone biosynthesis C-methylase UbiE
MKGTTPRTDSGIATSSCPHGVCPWYLGYLLASPVRRLLENPERMLRPFVRPGMTVLEPGSGMGFFSLPLARLVGADGRVVCVDLQRRMIDGLRRRARKAGVLDRVETAVCSSDNLGIGAWAGRIDLALVIHVIHEVPDADRFLRQIHAALRPGGRLVVIEPKGHVTPEQFEETLAAAEAVGFSRDLQAPATKPLQAALCRR